MLSILEPVGTSLVYMANRHYQEQHGFATSLLIQTLTKEVVQSRLSGLKLSVTIANPYSSVSKTSMLVRQCNPVEYLNLLTSLPVFHSVLVIGQRVKGKCNSCLESLNNIKLE